MEQLATPGTIRLTAGTLRLVEGLVQVQALGRVPVRGMAEQVDVFELLGADSSHRRFQATAARGLTPFVGRERELAVLQRALEQARAGHGQIVAPVGEPGVGKSRLFYELVHSPRTEGWLILEAGSVSYGKATAYLPAIDLLKAYCRVEARDDTRAIREKVTGKVLALDEALRPTLPALLALLDVPVEDASWLTLPPPQRRRETLDAIKRLLLRESREQPLLLVFEDLHWVDSETQALLDGLVESLPTARILLLVNYRPEYTHTWGNRSYYTQLQLDPLPPESAEELLDGLLGDGVIGAGGETPPLRALKTLLIERTEGNPFFLEESVRGLVETGALAGERGAHRLVSDLPSVRVPETVQAVLAARIDRLAPEDKRLLQTAAVIGKDVPYGVLRMVVPGVATNQGAASSAPTDGVRALLAAPPAHDDDAAALRAGLSRLQAAEFLYETALFPELEYTFKHALTHEVAYGSLLQERRKALHARIVEAIERLYPDRLVEHVDRLAHNAMRGELWEKAIAYCRQSGQKAMARSANWDAVPYFEQALSALGHLPEGRETVALAIDLRFELRTAFWSLGEFDRMHDRLREAEALAEAFGDRRRLALARAYLANYLRGTVDHRRAVETGERAIADADELGDLTIRLVASEIVAQSYHEMGELGSAIALLRRNIAFLASDRALERFGQQIVPAVHSRTVLAWCLAWQGNFAEAFEVLEEGRHVAETAGVPSTMANNCMGGLAYVIKGDQAGAIPRLQRALDIYRANSLRPGAHATSAFLGHAFTLAGRTEEAIALLEESLAGAAAIKFRPCTSLWTGWLAGAYLQAGRLTDAKQAGTRALELARAHRERGFEGYALWQLGEIAIYGESPDHERAEGLYRDALDIAEELGMRPLQAHCHLGLGKLYRRMGREHEARAALNVAIDLYLTMEMAHWLPEAEVELAGVS